MDSITQLDIRVIGNIQRYIIDLDSNVLHMYVYLYKSFSFPRCPFIQIKYQNTLFAIWAAFHVSVCWPGWFACTQRLKLMHMMYYAS